MSILVFLSINHTHEQPFTHSEKTPTFSHSKAQGARCTYIVLGPRLPVNRLPGRAAATNELLAVLYAHADQYV